MCPTQSKEIKEILRRDKGNNNSCTTDPKKNSQDWNRRMKDFKKNISREKSDSLSDIFDHSKTLLR